jgi:putative RecB family exonuclease
MLEREQRTPAAGARLVRSNWHDDGFADPEQSATWREQAADWVDRYLREERIRNPGAGEPRGVERTIAARTEVLALSGRADRIDDRDGEIVVVDYKTGRSRLTTDDARGSLALAVYAIAAERTLRQVCRTVELHHIPTGEVISWTHTPASLAQHIERAEHTATDIVAATDTVAGGADAMEVFEPKPGPHCSWCDFRRLCPEGQAASLTRRPWDGLGVIDAAAS